MDAYVLAVFLLGVVVGVLAGASTILVVVWRMSAAELHRRALRR